MSSVAGKEFDVMSNRLKFAGAAIAYAATAGCAHIDFESGSGLLYFDPVPYQ